MDMKKLLEVIELAEKPEEKELVPELNDKFKRWFGDSKVVDDNGQPLVCYHGSTVDIEEFDLGYSGSTTGNNLEQVFYFTSDEDTAITYSQEATVRENEWRFYDEETGFEDWNDYANHLRDEVFENPHINPCYLRIENPYIYDADYSNFDHKKNYALCSILKGNPQPDMEYWDEDFAMEIMDNFGYYNDEDEWVETGNSYDGVIIKNVIDNITSANQNYIDEYIVWDPYQIKSVYNKGIWDLNNPNVHENIKESFEKFDNGIIYTTSAYDVKNLLKDKPMRVVYDAERNYYFVGEAKNFIHRDLLQAGWDSGLYYDVDPEESRVSTVTRILYDGLETQSMLLLSYFPDDENTDLERSSDGYTNKYILDNGICYTHMFSPLEEFPLYKVLDVKKFIQLEMPESLTEKFEEIEEGIYTTNSAYDVLNRLKNKPSAYRVIYDNNINLYMIGDAFDYIHLDLLGAAFRSGFYPLMYSENEMGDYMDSCLEDGSMLLFSYDPDGGSIIDHEKSSDGYTRKYVYDYGTYYCHELTPLENFQLYKILGEPTKKEDIFENFKSLNKTLKTFL